jgi:hypothetical protein
MGHASRQQMAVAIQSGSWTGVPFSLTPTNINAVLSRLDCTACSLCKRNKRHKRHGTGLHGFLPGEELSIDYQGKISPTSARGFTGFYIIRDKYSGCNQNDPLRRRIHGKRRCTAHVPKVHLQHRRSTSRTWPSRTESSRT